MIMPTPLTSSITPIRSFRITYSCILKVDPLVQVIAEDLISHFSQNNVTRYVHKDLKNPDVHIQVFAQSLMFAITFAISLEEDLAIMETVHQGSRSEFYIFPYADPEFPDNIKQRISELHLKEEPDNSG